MAFARRVEGPAASSANEGWSTNVVSDELFDGHSFRVLTVVDNFARECPANEPRRGPDVVAVMNLSRPGKPTNNALVESSNYAIV